MRIQVDNEFQQVKVKDLNDQNNVEMFTSSVRGRKVFAAEQKIRELKSRIATLSVLKMKVTPTKIIQKYINSSENMNRVLNEKYGLSPNEIEKSLDQAKGSEHYLIFIELSEQKNYMTFWIGTIRKNTEQKEKNSEKNLILVKKF